MWRQIRLTPWKARLWKNGNRADVIGNPFPVGFERGGAARLAFNTSAFHMPAKEHSGIVAALNNWDVGIFKEFAFAESARLQVRIEAFNALNHTQVQLFGNTLGTPTFGIWNSARAPRILQFGLKMSF
jgi:hypothetical protein